MTKRLASLALALTLAAPATAFAQSFDAPYVEASRVERTQSRSFFGMPAWVDSARTGDAATTGSIAPRRGDETPVRGRLAPQGGLFAE